MARRLCLAAMATATLVAALPAPAARAARIMPASLSPLQLKGSGFHRRERVRVTVTPTVGTAITRRVRARRNGGFRLTVPRVRTCDGFEVTATGRRGSRASFVFTSVRGCS